MTSSHASITGWRFWAVSSHPGSRGELYGPYEGGDWGAHAACRASCNRNPEHVPPAPGCGCGIYAYDNLVDARLWMRRWHRNGCIINIRHRYVLGRVTLLDAIEFDQVPELVFETPGLKSRLVDAGAALRARAARIEELYVYDAADASPRDLQVLKCLLALRWDIPVQIGEPDYTQAQWAAKQTANSVCAQYGLLPPDVGDKPTAGNAASATGLWLDEWPMTQPN